MKKWLSKNRFIILLFLITVIAAFFRFYQLSDRLYFQLDEERDWHMFRRSIVFHRPPLIGSYLPPGLYLGPLWMYVSALIGLLTNLNPFVYGAIASGLGVLAIPLIYLVGKEVFESRKIGITASAIYSFSYLVSIYSRVWWPLVFSPLASLIVYYSLWKIKQGHSGWAWPMFAALTLALHGEPPNLTTLIIIVATVLIFKIHWKNRHFLGAALMFLFSHITLIIFEFKHNFIITNSLGQMLTKSVNPAITATPVLSVIPQILYGFTRIIYPSGKPDTVSQIGWCQEYLLERTTSIPLPLLITSALILFLFIIISLVKFRNQSFGNQLAVIHLIILVSGLIFFSFVSGTPIYEWFFYHLFPIFSFIWAIGLLKIHRISRIFFWLTLSAILLINFHTQIIAENSHGLAKKNQAVKFALSQIPAEAKFSIDSIGRCLAWSGYRTLFIQHGRIPAKSYLDELFGNWLYPAEMVNEIVERQIYFVDHEPYPFDTKTQEKYDRVKNSSIASRRFGAIEVFVTAKPTL